MKHSKTMKRVRSGQHGVGDFTFTPDPADVADREAWQILGLIVAEFESDPQSVACFDLRVVERAKALIAERRRLERRGVLPPVLTGPSA